MKQKYELDKHFHRYEYDVIDTNKEISVYDAFFKFDLKFWYAVFPDWLMR